MGCAGWWVTPSPLVLLQGCTNGQGCPWQGNLMETIPSGPLCLDSWLRWIYLVCLLLVITLTKPIHQDFSLLVADSPTSCGGWECWMWLMGCHCICPPKASLWCTIHKWLTTVPLVWPSFPHQRQWVTLLKWQRASGSCIPTSPITFGDSEGGTTWRNLRPLGKNLRA